MNTKLMIPLQLCSFYNDQTLKKKYYHQPLTSLLPPILRESIQRYQQLNRRFRKGWKIQKWVGEMGGRNWVEEIGGRNWGFKQTSIWLPPLLFVAYILLVATHGGVWKPFPGVSAPFLHFAFPSRWLHFGKPNIGTLPQQWPVEIQKPKQNTFPPSLL